MATCNQNNFTPTSILRGLPENQGGPGRHYCCNCAYQQGIEDSKTGWVPIEAEIVECHHGRMARLSVIDNLHQNQGGAQRHKCAVCAYAIGYGEDFELVDLEPTPENELEENSLVIVTAPTVLEPRTRTRNFIAHKSSAHSKAEHAAKIGLAGELFILQQEKERLRQANKEFLSNKVIHVSKKLGDGAGYDILSYNEDGSELHIEVKTTLSNSSRAFYISENELEFAKQHEESFRLYRVCNFDMERNSAELFILNTEELLKLNISPTNYICEF
jgi:uncharacterized protein DUF3883